MTFAKSDLPFGSEFSPSQIDLPELLKIVEKNQGDPKQLEVDILARYFSQHASHDVSTIGKTYSRAKLANNCKLGLIAYGIIDREANLTALGTMLLALTSDEQELYNQFAKHILLNLRGMSFVQCLLDMAAAGEDITLDTLREALAQRGLHFPRGGKHPSIMRLWLAKAGVIIGSRWQVDPLRLQSLLGTAPDDFPALALLTPTQRAFLLALANAGAAEPQPANEIARLAAATYGVRFPDKSLPKEVLNPLVAAGYISALKTTTGRGAKPFLVAATAKLDADVIAPLLDQLKDNVDPKLVALLKKPLAEIVAEIRSSDRYVSGLALEALAFKLMRSLAMDYAATRLRAAATGGAEVDLIFHSSRLVYSRWQVQCKNTARVALDDVAKEVGLTGFLKSTVIVIVTTGDIGSEARRYANKIMTDSNLALVMVDGSDINAVIQNPAHIVDVFNREAHHAMILKRLDLSAPPQTYEKAD